MKLLFIIRAVCLIKQSIIIKFEYVVYANQLNWIDIDKK